VLSGDLAAELRHLKEESGGDVIVYGGGSLAQSVVRSGLVDDFLLLTHPVVLGRGLPIFTKVEAPLDLELVYVRPFKGGTVAHSYRPKTR